MSHNDTTTGEGPVRFRFSRNGSRSPNANRNLNASERSLSNRLNEAGASINTSLDYSRNNGNSGVNRPGDLLQKRMGDTVAAPVNEVISRSNRDINGGGLLSFPPRMPRIYMAFNFAEYTRPSGFERLELAPKQTIHLPLPMQLLESYMVDVGAEDTNFVGDAARNVSPAQVHNLIDNLKRGEIIDAFGEEGAISAMFEAGSSFGTRFLKDRANGMIGNMGDVALQLIGVAPNPHTSVFFHGVRLRQLMFSWKLSAQSKEESDTLKAIIDAFRENSLPAMDDTPGNSFLLKYPNIVKPEIIGTEYGFDFKYAFVTNMTVVHTPEEPAYYKSGAPVSYLLTLDLMEIEYFLRDDKRPSYRNYTPEIAESIEDGLEQVQAVFDPNPDEPLQ